MFLAFVAFPGLADVLEREDGPTSCFYALISAILLQFGLGVEVSEMEEAVKVFSGAVLAGKGPKDCLRAFRGHGVHGVRLVMRVYSVLSALLVVVLTWTLLGRVKSRALLLALLTTTVMLIPVDTGPSPCRSGLLERGYNGPEAAHASARGTLALDDQRVIARPRAGRRRSPAGRSVPGSVRAAQFRHISAAELSSSRGEGAERIKACLPKRLPGMMSAWVPER